MEDGETPEDTVVREVREETGLVVTVVQYLGLYRLRDNDVAFDIHEFQCAPIDEEAAAAGDDAAEVRWAEVADFASLGVTEAVAEVVGRAARRPAKE